MFFDFVLMEPSQFLGELLVLFPKHEGQDLRAAE